MRSVALKSKQDVALTSGEGFASLAISSSGTPLAHAESSGIYTSFTPEFKAAAVEDIANIAKDTIQMKLLNVDLHDLPGNAAVNSVAVPKIVHFFGSVQLSSSSALRC